MLRRCIPWLALSVLTFAWVTPARAQLTDLREHARTTRAGGTVVGGGTALFFGGQDGSQYSYVSPRLMLAHRAGPVVLETLTPLGYVHEGNSPGNDRNAARFGNLWFGASYLPDCYCGLSRLTLGIAAPTARADGDLQRRTLELGRGTQGDWHGYLWMPDLVPLVMGAGGLRHFGPLRLSVDGDLVVGLPGGGRDSEVGMQLMGDAALRLGGAARWGVSANAAYWPTFQGDVLRLAAATYLRVTTDRESMGVRFVLPVDDPYGRLRGGARQWGLHLFFATTF